MSNKVTSVSAPGKALIAGGYLVLESPNPGLVLATDSCFHTSISLISIDYNEGNPDKDVSAFSLDLGESQHENYKCCPLDVFSPQFHTVYSYWLLYDCTWSQADKYASTNSGIPNETKQKPFMKLISRTSDQASNIFIEKTLTLTLSFVLYSIGYEAFSKFLPFCPSGICSSQSEYQTFGIKLRADNDFYSQIHHLHSLNLSSTPANVASLPPFLPCPLTDDGKVTVNKTGLGSSAALVTSLVGAILCHFDVVSLPHDRNTFKCNTSAKEKDTKTVTDSDNLQSEIRMVHNLAQICHSLAQGKIGSGFDVSAAVYGTHVYTRFSKAVISDVMDILSTSMSTSNHTFPGLDGISGVAVGRNAVNEMHACVNGKSWDAIVEPFQLPLGMEMLMADVCGGSESPSMARKVLAWKKEACNSEDMKTANGEKIFANNGVVVDDSSNKKTKNETNLWDSLKSTNIKLKDLFQTANLQMIMGIPKFLSAKHIQECYTTCIVEVEGNETNTAAALEQLTNDAIRNGFTMPGYDDPNHCKSEIRSYLQDVILPSLKEIQAAQLESRQYLKAMGDAAGVPIEPDIQTELADTTMKMNGVVAAGVPGAGGYDALFVLYIRGGETSIKTDALTSDSGGGARRSSKSDDVRDSIGKLWMKWSEEKNVVVCPLACKSVGFGGVFGLRRTELTW